MTTHVVHLSGTGARAVAARQRPAGGVGCLIVAGLVVLGLAVEYWYLSVPFVVVAIAVAIARKWRAGKHARPSWQWTAAPGVGAPGAVAPASSTPTGRCAYCGAAIVTGHIRCPNCSAPL